MRRLLRLARIRLEVPDRRLALLGCLSLAAYAGVATLSLGFRYDEPPTGRPILAILALFGLLCGLYLSSLLVIAGSSHPVKKSESTAFDTHSSNFRGVLLFSVLFRFVLLFSVPIQEVDFYRYLWDGRVLWQGVNPYRYSPAQIDAADSDGSTDLSELAALRDSSVPVNEIFNRVHHRQVPTIYPPLAQAMFVACAAMTPAAAPGWLHLLVLRVLLILVDVAILYSMRALLRSVGMSDGWCLAYGWCPLAIKEVANSAHIDGLAVLFTLVMLRFLTRAMESQPARQRWRAPWAIAGGCLGLAILSKSYPIILLPLLASFAIARIGLRAVIPLFACATVLIAGYLPFWDRPENLGTSNSCAASAGAPLAGLQTFLTQWQMNDLLFMVVHENLRQPRGETNRWFVVMPAGWQREINRQDSSSFAKWRLGPDVDPAFVVTQLVMGTLLFGLTLRWAWMVYRKPETLVLLRSAFLVLVWAWFLSSTQNPWYVLWFLPLMPFARCRSWFLVPCLALIYYLRFWLVHQGAWIPATGECPGFDYRWVWFEHGFVFGALAVESWIRRDHGRGARHSGWPGGTASSGSTRSLSGASDG